MDGNCWSELPLELLSLVCDGLDVPQIVRFGAVCRSWRSVVVHYTPYRPRVLAPWLISSKDREQPTTTIFRLFDLCENRHYSIDTLQPAAADPSEARGRRHCLGSSFGWVVAMDKENLRISLLNPIAARRIVLPPLYLSSSSASKRHVVRVLRHKEGHQGLTDECTEEEEEEMCHPPLKAMLSSPPGHGGEDWTVVVTFDPYFDPHRLAYVRPRDHVWTMVDVSVPIFDVICHQDQVYTLSGDGKISTWDFSTQPPKCTVIFSPKIPIPAAIGVEEDDLEEEEEYYSVEFGYLVPCPRTGDFLQVWRFPSCSIEYRMGYTMKMFTKVFRVDSEGQELHRIRSLDGDTIFAGRNAPVRISSHGDFSWLRRDCIYFSDQRFARGFPVEVYELAEDRDAVYTLPHLLEDFCYIEPYSIWFTPSLA